MTYDELLNKYDCKGLEEDPRLGRNLCMVALSGSRAYGTDTEGSDYDIRGFATRSAREILVGRDWGVVNSDNSDIDLNIYSFEKFITLLKSSNPHVIELLGLREEDYLYLSPVGELLLSNKDMFLSKEVYRTFTGAAKSNLIRIEKILRNPECLIYTDKVSKMMMHSARLLYTLSDLLQYREVVSHRGENLSILHDIRDGKYLEGTLESYSPYSVSNRYVDLIESLEEDCRRKLETTELPEFLDVTKIDKFIYDVNMNIVTSADDN